MKEKSVMYDTFEFWQRAGSWPFWTAVGGIGTAIAAILGRIRKRINEDSNQTLDLVIELVGLLKEANETITDLRKKVEMLEQKVDELSARLCKAVVIDAVY